MQSIMTLPLSLVTLLTRVLSFFSYAVANSIVKAFLGKITFPITSNRNSFFNLSASNEIENEKEEEEEGKMACRLFGYCGD